MVRDYDTSIPEFRGDREQLIQAVLNIAHNAAQALADRIAAGDAQITFRTRVRGRSHLANSAIGWHWNCMSSTTGLAYRTRSRTASFSRWCRGGMAVPGWG